jgi:hypothetical protein
MATSNLRPELMSIQELKTAYRSATQRRARATNQAADDAALMQMAELEAEIARRNATLAAEGRRRRVRLDKYQWSTAQVLLAYAIWRMHGVTAMAVQVAYSHGDEQGMGGDSMMMKVSAFQSNKDGGTGTWNLCETGRSIAIKYADKTPYEVERLSGFIVQF